MAEELISREALIEDIHNNVLFSGRTDSLNAEIRGANKVIDRISVAPSVDAVSRGVYEQIKWERDIAMAQLEEHGIAFGAKKQGDVIVLPCKVGDTVWVVFANGIRPYTVDRIHIMANNQVKVRMRFMVTETLYQMEDNFGKTVFLTREEAEKALGERKEKCLTQEKS